MGGEGLGRTTRGSRQCRKWGAADLEAPLVSKEPRTAQRRGRGADLCEVPAFLCSNARGRRPGRPGGRHQTWRGQQGGLRARRPGTRCAAESGQALVSHLLGANTGVWAFMGYGFTKKILGPRVHVRVNVWQAVCVRAHAHPLDWHGLRRGLAGGPS